jgi:hypothetical protein
VEMPKGNLFMSVLPYSRGESRQDVKQPAWCFIYMQIALSFPGQADCSSRVRNFMHI